MNKIKVYPLQNNINKKPEIFFLKKRFTVSIQATNSYFHLHTIGSIKKIYAPVYICLESFTVSLFLISHATVRDNSSGVLYVLQQI
jgi:hypothetical protein